MVHKMQFSEDCVFNNVKARLLGEIRRNAQAKRPSKTPRQQKENQGHTKGKAEKIFIDPHAENGIYRCVLYRCKALRQQ